MTLRSYLRVLRERWRVVALMTLLTTALAVLITGLTQRVYQAKAEIFVASNTSNDGSSQYGANAALLTAIQTYAKLAVSDEVVKSVQKELNLPLSASDIKAKISTTVPLNSTLINVYVDDTSADRAANIANSATQALIKVLEDRLTPTGDTKPTATLSVAVAATSPSTPVKPQPVLNISLGIFLGLLIGIALAVARELLDNRLKDADVLAKAAGLPLMGVIVEDPKTSRHPIATRAGTRNTRAENFRQLRANLQFANVDAHPRVIAVTSSIPSEGKTTVSINLASTLAEAGFTVCLVDADLRRPTIAKTLGLLSPVGLTSVLIHEIALSEAMQSAGSSLYVLTSGPTPPNPSEVLASSYVRNVIRSLLERVDYVVIDTAPLLPVADGSEVAALADGTLLVARWGETTDTQVKRAVEHLRRVDATMLGVVLNRVPLKRNRGEYGYTYYREEVEAPAHARRGEAPTRRTPPGREHETV